MVCKTWWYYSQDSKILYFKLFTVKVYLWKKRIENGDGSPTKLRSNQLIPPDQQYKRLYFELGNFLFHFLISIVFNTFIYNFKGKQEKKMFGYSLIRRGVSASSQDHSEQSIAQTLDGLYVAYFFSYNFI